MPSRGLQLSRRTAAIVADDAEPPMAFAEDAGALAADDLPAAMPGESSPMGSAAVAPGPAAIGRWLTGGAADHSRHKLVGLHS